ncbi:MAG: type II toxin-antitoxin system VapC family toxin [Promethearchaeota archaeon]
MVFIDSDLAISFLSRRKNKVNQKAKQIMQDLFENHKEIKITIFNQAELLRGAYISSKVALNIRILEEFLQRFTIIPFTNVMVSTYAKIYAELQIQGKKIGDFDELIASIVIANEDVLYTRNIKHFDKIKLLKIINWEKI